MCKTGLPDPNRVAFRTTRRGSASPPDSGPSDEVDRSASVLGPAAEGRVWNGPSTTGTGTPPGDAGRPIRSRDDRLGRAALTAELSADEARRIALAAQGFTAWRRRGTVDAARLLKGIDQLGLLQIDSVNVLVRAHYMPLFSRLGAYDRTLLDAVAAARSKPVFEYWGHEASLLPIACQPLLRWRMERARRGQDVWRQLAPFAGERRSEADALLARIERDGALAASDVAGTRASQGMWAWSAAKHALEWLFWAGLVAATHRRGSFERVYDLPERVLPRAILQVPTPSEVDARRNLIARSARALGVATAHDLRDYSRIGPTDARLPIDQLVEEGALVPVRVRGWLHQAYLHKDARLGRTRAGAALVSPFDRSSGIARAPRGCSASAIAWRSTRLPTSASTATMSCRFFWMVRSSPAWT